MSMKTHRTTYSDLVHPEIFALDLFVVSAFLGFEMEHQPASVASARCRKRNSPGRI